MTLSIDDYGRLWLTGDGDDADPERIDRDDVPEGLRDEAERLVDQRRDGLSAARDVYERVSRYRGE